MRIENSDGAAITDIAAWEKVFEKEPHHWKPGRSAHSIADFILHRNGEERLRTLVSAALGEDVEFERAVPELEVRFDKYGKGRVHDLGIYGRTASGVSLFVGVEAKVDESFGDTVSKVYRQAKSREDSGAVTNAPARVEELLAANGLESDPADCNLRYQLLYATVGTTAADADLCVLVVGVFRTELYAPARGAENLEDYLEFMKGVRGRRGPRRAEPVRVAFPNEHVRGRRCYSGRTGASAKLPHARNHAEETLVGRVSPCTDPASRTEQE